MPVLADPGAQCDPGPGQRLCGHKMNQPRTVGPPPTGQKARGTEAKTLPPPEDVQGETEAESTRSCWRASGSADSRNHPTKQVAETGHPLRVTGSESFR